MKRNFLKIITRYLIPGMLLLFVSLSAYGKDEVTRHVIELNLGVGYYTFDSKRELTDMEMAGMGFGVHFFRRWAVLLNYSALNSERTGIQAGEKVDVQKFHVDVYRYFNTEHKFRPYIVAGLGRMDIISEGDKRDETQWNGGLGLSYRITPKWFLRGDGRVLYNESGNHTDYAYMLTLAFRLKEGERGD